ncbi:MAG: hypothetical protein RSB55_09700, partial [Oscillospiraceae bacterium]
TAKDQTAAVVITIGSDNYETFTVTLSFGITAKRSVTLTGLTALNSTYDGTGKAGYQGTLLVENKTISDADKAALIFTYTGINGTVYKSTLAPVNAGSYNLVVSVDGTNVTYTGRHVDIPFTIGKAPITVEQGGYTIHKIWDGNTKVKATGSLSVTGGVNSGMITATPRNYPSPGVGSYDVMIDLVLTDSSGNYTLKNSTITVTGTISQSSGSPAAPDKPTAMTVRDTSITLQPLFIAGETVEYGVSDTDTAPKSWKDFPDFTGLNAATTYHFFARVKESANHGAGAVSASAAITTEKKVSPPIAPKGMTFPVGETWESDFTVAELLNEWEYHEESPLPKDAKFTNVIAPADTKVLESISIDGTTGKLVFKSKNNTDVAGEDVFYITVAFGQYEAVTFPLTFRNSVKSPAIITATVASKEYDGKAVVQP